MICSIMYIHSIIYRLARRIPRRQYHVIGPHHVWHCDGCHQLVKYHFVIHGGLDGYSRTAVFLSCSTNNRAVTMLGAFLQAVDEYEYRFVFEQILAEKILGWPNG